LNSWKSIITHNAPFFLHPLICERYIYGCLWWTISRLGIMSHNALEPPDSQVLSSPYSTMETRCQLSPRSSLLSPRSSCLYKFAISMKSLSLQALEFHSTCTTFERVQRIEPFSQGFDLLSICIEHIPHLEVRGCISNQIIYYDWKMWFHRCLSPKRQLFIEWTNENLGRFQMKSILDGWDLDTRCEHVPP